MVKKKREKVEKINSKTSINHKISQEDSKSYAFLATLLSIVGFVMALLIRKDDEYVMYYAKQSLVIFIGFVISSVISIMPIIGPFIGWILYALSVVFWIMSWIFSLTGEEKKIPFVSEIAKGFDF